MHGANDRRPELALITPQYCNQSITLDIAVFPILADVVKVMKGSGSTAHWSIDFIRLSRWLRRCFTQLITPLDIDGIGQSW